MDEVSETPQTSPRQKKMASSLRDEEMVNGVKSLIQNFNGNTDTTLVAKGIQTNVTQAQGSSTDVVVSATQASTLKGDTATSNNIVDHDDEDDLDNVNSQPILPPIQAATMNSTPPAHPDEPGEFVGRDMTEDMATSEDNAKDDSQESVNAMAVTPIPRKRVAVEPAVPVRIVKKARQSVEVPDTDDEDDALLSLPPKAEPTIEELRHGRSLFDNLEYRRVREEFPSETSSYAMMNKVDQRWRNLDDFERQSYIDKAKADHKILGQQASGVSGLPIPVPQKTKPGPKRFSEISLANRSTDVESSQNSFDIEGAMDEEGLFVSDSEELEKAATRALGRHGLGISSSKAVKSSKVKQPKTSAKDPQFGYEPFIASPFSANWRKKTVDTLGGPADKALHNALWPLYEYIGGQLGIAAKTNAAVVQEGLHGAAEADQTIEAEEDEDNIADEHEFGHEHEDTEGLPMIHCGWEGCGFYDNDYEALRLHVRFEHLESNLGDDFANRNCKWHDCVEGGDFIFERQSELRNHVGGAHVDPLDLANAELPTTSKNDKKANSKAGKTSCGKGIKVKTDAKAGIKSGTRTSKRNAKPAFSEVDYDWGLGDLEEIAGRRVKKESESDSKKKKKVKSQAISTDVVEDDDDDDTIVVSRVAKKVTKKYGNKSKSQSVKPTGNKTIYDTRSNTYGL